MKRPSVRSAPLGGGSASADLAGALHEVSNTLTVVLGWLDAARAEVKRGSGHDAIEVALSHARLGRAIARRAIGAEVDDGNVTRSALSVARDAAQGVAQEAARTGIRIEVADPADDDLLISAAPFAQQILINLLLNAVQFSPPRGIVVLSVESRAGSMCFSVTDEGSGISPDRIETLFISADSTRPGGAGIGLRHAHALALSHGGRLDLVDTGPSGSEFELVWPIGEAPSRAIRTVPPQSLDGLRVLLLEDDVSVQALVDLGLSTRGAAVATASTMAELVKMLQNGVFDVALLDLSPLGKAPADALQLIDARQPGLPVVVISGSVAPDVDAPNIAAWVRKPFEVAELVAALTRLRSFG